MTQELNENASRTAMKKTIERAVEETKEFTETDLKLDERTPTGACYLYTYGVSSCTSGITEKACRKAATNAGVSWDWKKDKTCSEINCPP